MSNDDTVPVDRSALLNLLDETFDLIEWLIPMQDHPAASQINLPALEKAHKEVVGAFEKWTVDRIEEDLSEHSNVTSIFTKLQFFRE
jgi:hypothetical protein